MHSRRAAARHFALCNAMQLFRDASQQCGLAYRTHSAVDTVTTIIAPSMRRATIDGPFLERGTEKEGR